MEHRLDRPGTDPEAEHALREEGLVPDRPSAAGSGADGRIVPGPGARPPITSSGLEAERRDLDGGAPRARTDSAGRPALMSWGALNVPLGVWLMVSPLLLGYESGDARWHDAALGALIAAVAAGRVGSRRRPGWAAGVEVGLGLWVLAAAFWLADSPTAVWNDIVIGALVAAIAAAAARVSRPSAG